MAKGFSQREGKDFDFIYSPVVKSATIRTILALSTSRKWPLQHLDVCNASMNGNFQEEVFIAQPPGFRDPNKPDHVCLLRRVLYGLKQAPREWYRRLKTFLESIGFHNSLCDPSLFIRRKSHKIIIALVYVDDFVITGSNDGDVAEFIRKVCKEFHCRNLGQLSCFLGVEASYSMGCLHISQQKYFVELLTRFGLVECKPLSTPEAPGTHLNSSDGIDMDDPSKFRSLVGALQYLTLSRPDIAHSVNQVCKFMHRPTDHHWKAAKRILRYIKGTLLMGLEFRPSQSMDLQVYVDSD